MRGLLEISTYCSSKHAWQWSFICGMIEPMLLIGRKQLLVDAGFIKRLFVNDSDSTHRVRMTARMIRDGIGKINPFIQQSTSSVCPACRDVCCRNKHGYHNEEDLIYLSALGIEPPANSSGRQDTDPCHFLTEKGCSLERTIRPSGCNWYFCDSLYDYMETRPDYEEFDKALGDVAELWMQMTEEFRRAAQQLCQSRDGLKLLE